MPSSATITAFHSFAPSTVIRSAHHNTNFGNFRGHLLSIEPLTATSSHLTYDVGSVDHAWRGVYSQYQAMYQNTASALPPTPGAGFMSLYFKDDKGLYSKDPAGSEVPIGISSVGISQTVSNGGLGNVSGALIDASTFKGAKFFGVLRRTDDTPLDLVSFVEFSLLNDNGTWRITDDGVSYEDVSVDFSVAMTGTSGQIQYTAVTYTGANPTGALRWTMVKF